MAQDLCTVLYIHAAVDNHSGLLCDINLNSTIYSTVCKTKQSCNNPLRQGVELLLDQAFYLVFLIVVSETQGSKSVKWLLSCHPIIKPDLMLNRELSTRLLREADLWCQALIDNSIRTFFMLRSGTIPRAQLMQLPDL